MRRWIAAVSVVFVLAGCSGDDGTTGPQGSQHADVSGIWTYNATNLSGTYQGVGIACSIEGMSLTLTQSGTTFSGSTGPSTATCAAGGQVESIQLGGTVVVNGAVDGNSVSFDIETSDYHHTGTVSGNSMSGTCSLRLDLGDAVVTMTGPWAAGRSAAASLVPSLETSLVDRFTRIVEEIR